MRSLRMPPPAFLLVANDDGAARTIANLFQRYRAARAPVEAHIYNRGGHAFNMGHRSRLVSVQKWPQRLADWMTDNFILDPTGKAEYDQQVRERRERNRRRRERWLQRQREGRRPPQP